MNRKIELEFEKAVENLLNMASITCKNKISENLQFVLSKIKKIDSDNQEITRKKNIINCKKKPKGIVEILKELSDFYIEVYDINLQILKAEKNRTIIEVRYFLKSELDKEYLKTVVNNEPMLHSKISIPRYRKNEDEKFDVNWELGGIVHNWKDFWWKKKTVRELKNMNRN